MKRQISLIPSIIAFIIFTFVFSFPIQAQVDPAQVDPAQQLWEKGHNLVGLNDQEAISAFIASIDLKPSKDAYIDLATAYYNTGNIAAAAASCNNGLNCAFIFDTVWTAKEIDGLIGETLDTINKHFAPLRVRLRGVRMNSLARIDNVNYRFDLQALKKTQMPALRKIEEGKSLQMTGIGEDGTPFCEIPYFPVLQETFTGRIPSYTLEISPDRRYRFDFNLSNYKQFVLDIDWQKEFVPTESIPPDHVKIITPGKYSFDPLVVQVDSTEALQGVIRNRELQTGENKESNVFYIHLPEEKEKQLKLEMTGSEEKRSESTLDIIAKIGFIAAGIGLISFVR